MTEKTPAVSIVIPVYNCGAMFPLCLVSIMLQEFSDFEVIIVNNGSTDGSADFAQACAERDSRLRVIDVPHGGAGSARNAGVAEAAGKYICFIDGDDCISSDYLTKLYNAAENAEADIAVCGFDRYFLNTKKTKRGLKTPDRTYTREEALTLLLGDTKIKFYLWGKLFKRRLFTEHDITIPDMYYEDAVSTTKLFFFANRVASVDLVGYHYTRAFSAYKETNMSLRRVHDYVNTIPMIRLFLEEQGCFVQFKKKMRPHIFHVYYALPSIIRQCGGEATRPAELNIRRARAKIRLCMKTDPCTLRRLDLDKPVVK